jgi:hypothetical protein
MISRELFSRLRAGLRAGQFQDGKVEWRGDIGAPPFKLKAMWATPAGFVQLSPQDNHRRDEKAARAADAGAVAGLLTFSGGF